MPVPVRRSGAARLVIVTASLLAIGLVVALSVAGWALESTAVARWLVARAVAASDGRLQADGLQGNLRHGLQAARLVWRDPGGNEYQADGLAIAWHLRALLVRQVHLQSLSADTLRLSLKPSDDKAQLPATLALPWAVRIDEARVGSLLIAPLARDGQPAPQPVELTGISLALRYRAERYQLERLMLASPWGSLQAQANLQAVAPFALDATLRAQARVGDPAQTLPASVRLAGPLQAIDWQGELAWRDSPFKLSGRLAPFDDQPLGPVQVSGTGIELRKLLDGGPQATLNLDALIEPDLAGADGPAVSGRLTLDNTTPGQADQSRLPVRRFSGRFAWHGQQLGLTDLALSLPEGGAVTGSGSVDLGRAGQSAREPLAGIDLSLLIADLNLAGLSGGIKPTVLSGKVRLDRGGIGLDLREAGKLLTGGLGLTGQLQLAGRRLTIERAELGARDSALRLAGSVDFGDGVVLDLTGQAERFATERWFTGTSVAGAPAWNGLFNGSWQVAGRVAPQLDAKARVVLTNSRVNGLPTSGSLQASVNGSATEPLQRVRDAQLSLQLGTSQLSASGALGTPGDRMAVRLAASSLAELDPRLSGRLDLDATLQDSLRAPSVRGSLRLAGAALRADQPYKLANLKSEFDLADAGAGRLSLQLQAQGLVIGSETIERLAATLDGTGAAHQLTLSGTGRGLTLQLAGSGRLDQPASDPWTWSGQLANLSLGEPLALQLRQPASLLLRPDAARIDGLDLTVAQGRVQLAQARWEAGRFAVRGEIDGIQVDRLVDSVRRLQPQLIDPALGSQPTGIGVNARFDLEGSSIDDLSGSASFDSRSAQVDAASQGQLVFTSGALAGDLKLAMPSLRWTRRYVGNDWKVDGSLAFDGKVGGRLRAPRLSGLLTGNNLMLDQQTLGWRFTDGKLAARFGDDRISLSSLRFASQRGSIELSGDLALPPTDGQKDGLNLGRGRFELRADHLPLAVTPGDKVVLSGATVIDVLADSVTWRGKLAVDEGRLELKDIDSPTRPDDLVIIDRRKPAVPAPAAAPVARDRAAGKEPAVTLKADLELDMGDKFLVSGSGVEGRLQGAIKLRGELPDAPNANGVVTVVDGKYRAYGQELQITRGRVIFNGALDNPALDIVAMRKTATVDAGVALSGTAQAPRVRLVSSPELSDAEKLSWLVLGVGLDDARSGSQTVALQAAASAIFGSGEGQGMAAFPKLFGLDTIGLGNASSTGLQSALPGTNTASGMPAIPGGIGASGSAGSAGAQQNVLTAGKRLSSRLYISYEQGLRGTWNLLKLQYDITSRLSLRALTGTESAIDLLFFRSFD